MHLFTQLLYVRSGNIRASGVGTQVELMSHSTYVCVFMSVVYSMLICAYDVCLFVLYVTSVCFCVSPPMWSVLACVCVT